MSVPASQAGSNDASGTVRVLASGVSRKHIHLHLYITGLRLTASYQSITSILRITTVTLLTNLKREHHIQMCNVPA